MAGESLEAPQVSDGPPRAEIPDPDKWMEYTRTIGTAVLCPTCGKATVGETNWCPYCTFEKTCQELFSEEVRFSDGKLVIDRNRV